MVSEPVSSSSLDGLLLVDKPAGMTSAQVLTRLKRTYRAIKKIGHAGTLDPLGTGLLICLLGKTTRLAQYAESGQKEYQGTIQLGIRTSTDDVEGEVLESSILRPSDERLQIVRDELFGRSSQMPPTVSALKVDGKRAYQLQREGKEVTLASRPVSLDEFDLWRIDPDTIGYRIVCGKGFYVRAIARDCGELLGCGACVQTLRRTASFPFLVSEAVPLEDVQLENLVSWERLFPTAPSFEPSPRLLERLLAGDTRVLGEVPPVDGAKVCIFKGANTSSGGLLLSTGASENKAAEWRFGVNIGKA